MEKIDAILPMAHVAQYSKGYVAALSVGVDAFRCHPSGKRYGHAQEDLMGCLVRNATLRSKSGQVHFALAVRQESHASAHSPGFLICSLIAGVGVASESSSTSC